jgi:hypothetical protein
MKRPSSEEEKRYGGAESRAGASVETATTLVCVSIQIQDDK